jgi:predicted small lipoprotein YifL
MNPRIACFTLVLLSVAACGQSGKLVLPDKTVATPKAEEPKAQVVAPVTDAAPITPAQTAPDATKKVQP